MFIDFSTSLLRWRFVLLRAGTILHIAVILRVRRLTGLAGLNDVPWIDVQVPVDSPVFAVALDEPLIRLGEVVTIKLYSLAYALSTTPLPNCKLTKPLIALSGLGCTLFKMRCLSTGMPTVLFCAGEPHAINTTPLLRTFTTVSMTFCVSSSHPLPWWELASPLRTVRQVFSSRTPRSAQGVSRPPFFGGGW